MREKFLYGAATSAHQVEGNNVHNDWWEWEQTRPAAMRSGRAADHYSLFGGDFQLARNLGHTAHRLSVEWSRIEPARGVWNKDALRHYREVLTALRDLGLASFVTLHHFTNPQWFAKRGGWAGREADELFARYVKVVVEHLGDLVDFWVTVNEPMLYASLSYWRKRWPPQERHAGSFLAAIGNLAQGHRRAYRVIHRSYPRARVGIAKHVIAYQPAKRQVDDRLFVRLEDWWFNHRFLALTRGSHDFLGINYYFKRMHRVTVFPPAVQQIQLDGPQTDLGWPISSDGLLHVLMSMKRYGLPIYITENGLADAKDAQRGDFIRSHLRAVEQAQQQGADVQGYLHWSLLDNFEWDLGFEPRFGLVAVDYETMKRTVRPSAWVYKAIIEAAS